MNEKTDNSLSETLENEEENNLKYTLKAYVTRDLRDKRKPLDIWEAVKGF